MEVGLIPRPVVVQGSLLSELVAVGGGGDPAAGGVLGLGGSATSTQLSSVDEPVVEVADQGEVVQVGAAFVPFPVSEVVDLAAAWRDVAAGK